MEEVIGGEAGCRRIEEGAGGVEDVQGSAGGAWRMVLVDWRKCLGIEGSAGGGGDFGHGMVLVEWRRSRVSRRVAGGVKEVLRGEPGRTIT